MAGVAEFPGDSHQKTQQRERAIAALAARQHGVVAARQLAALGLTYASVRHRVRTGRLHVVHRGVYAVGHPRITRRGRWMAAVLACGDGAVLSHRSAAALLGLRPDGRSSVDVIAAGRGRRSRRGITLHSASGLKSGDHGTCDGIPVTSVPRTLLDLAAVVDARQLERAFEAAERMRLLDMRALHELAHRSRGHHGLGAFRRLIDHLHDVPETATELERRFIDLCDNHALPRPACNVALEGFVVDALWPHARLVAELDSFGFHRTRAMFESDRARDATLQLAGYRVLRITSRRMEHDADRVAEAIRGLLA